MYVRGAQVPRLQMHNRSFFVDRDAFGKGDGDPPFWKPDLSTEDLVTNLSIFKNFVAQKQKSGITEETQILRPGLPENLPFWVFLFDLNSISAACSKPNTYNLPTTILFDFIGRRINSMWTDL